MKPKFSALLVPLLVLVAILNLNALILAQEIIKNPPINVDHSIEARIDLNHGAMFGARSAIITSNTGNNPFEGLEVNLHVGADEFYDHGYTGERVVITNIEAGHIWNQHETFQHVLEFFDARATYAANNTAFGQLGQADRHAVWVAQAIGGRTANNFAYQRGIAFDAELWSGAISTGWVGNPFTTAFNWSRGYALTDAYSLPTLIGSGGRVADVVASSWGSFNPNSPFLQGGSDIFTVAVDGIAKQSGIPFVFCAGNSGPDINTIWAPGAGGNVICVGALRSDTTDPPYRLISTTSSRGPQRYNGPDGDFGLVRARVDICAPGTDPVSYTHLTLPTTPYV